MAPAVAAQGQEDRVDGNPTIAAASSVAVVVAAEDKHKRRTSRSNAGKNNLRDSLLASELAQVEREYQRRAFRLPSSR